MPDPAANPTRTADPSRTTLRGLTGRRLETVEWPFLFLEQIQHDPQRQDEAPVYVDDGGRAYGPIRSTPDRQKWLYVFDYDPDGDGYASLQWEGRYDEGGRLELVNWASGGMAGKDERAATKPAEEVSPNAPGQALPLVFEQTASGAQPHRQVYALLSHVQLSAYRLDEYTGTSPADFFTVRCTRLKASAEENGEPVESVYKDEAAGVCYGLLTDYVDVAQQLSTRYQAALARHSAYVAEHGARALHARMTTAVAESYQEQEDEDAAPGRPTERAGAFLQRYDDEQATRQARVEERSEVLFQWMEQLAFKLARRDGSTFAEELASVSEAQQEKIEGEVMRQAQLLEGAAQSEAGVAYLQRYLGQKTEDTSDSWTDWYAPGADPWYTEVMLSAKLTRLLAAVPSSYFRRLADQADTVARSARAALSDLKAQRVRAYSIVIEQAELARLHAQAPALEERLIQRQLRVLEPLHEAARPNAGSLVLPGDPVSTGGAAGGSPGLMRPWQALLEPGRSLDPTDLTPLRLRTLELEARAMGAPGQSQGPAQYRTFRFEQTTSGLVKPRRTGLLVLPGEGTGRAAMVRARGVLGTSGPTLGPQPGADAMPPRQRRRALARSLGELLPDSEGRPTGLTDLNEQIATKQEALSQARLEQQLSTRRLNWAGRLMLGLGVLEIAASVPDLMRKAEEGEEMSEAGRSWWASYQGAVGSGVGLAGAVAETVGGLEMVMSVQKGSRLAFGLRAFGVVGAIAGIVASIPTMQSELETHDTVGAWSAGFAIGGASLTLLGMIPALSVLGPVGIALGIASMVAFFLSDTKLEEWLVTCYWSEEETEEVAKLEGAGLRKRLGRELDKLFELLARPQLRVELWDGGAGENDSIRIADYGSTMREVPTYVRLVVQPGLAPPGTRYEITDLKVGRKERLFGFIGEETFTLSVSATVPDETHDVVVTREVSGEGGTARLPAAFLRQWKLGEVPLGDVEGLLKMAPAGLSFEASVSVQIEEPGQAQTELDQRYRMSGPLAYTRFDGSELYSSRTTTIEPVEES